MKTDNPILQQILAHYVTKPANAKVTILGEGSINDTYLIKADGQNLVLQRINSKVFPHPERLIQNLQLVSQHLLLSQTDKQQQHWKDLLLIPTLSGNASVQDKEKNLWRALSFIEESISLSKLDTIHQATQIGLTLGRFHKRVSGLRVENLQIPLPGFHLLSGYLKTYDELDEKNTRSGKIHYCTESIKKHRESALSLERIINRRKIQKTIIHGDPKIGNILFAKETGNAISIIDYDTIGPGYLQHDLGDFLRSVCNQRGEDASEESRVEFDILLCRAALAGYFQEAEDLLSTDELESIFDGIVAITFELGLRFFTDYLQGNVYFKVSNPEDNLQKALVQFKLLQDISEKESHIRNLTYQ